MGSRLPLQFTSHHSYRWNHLLTMVDIGLLPVAHLASLFDVVLPLNSFLCPKHTPSLSSSVWFTPTPNPLHRALLQGNFHFASLWDSYFTLRFISRGPSHVYLIYLIPALPNSVNVPFPISPDIQLVLNNYLLIKWITQESERIFSLATKFPRKNSGNELAG